MNKPNDHQAALEWAQKYEKVQGDSTLGNFMRCYMELRELSKAYLDTTTNVYTQEEKALRAILKGEE